MKRLIAFCLFCVSLSVAYGASDSNLDEQDVLPLRKSVLQGDQPTIARLFAMHGDGAVAEDIDIVLGATIRPYPKMFLEELRRSWRADCTLCMPGLLGNLGDEYVDRFEAQTKELEARRLALATIRDKPLLKLRDTCLRVLDEEIQETRKAANDSRR